MFGSSDSIRLFDFKSGGRSVKLRWSKNCGEVYSAYCKVPFCISFKWNVIIVITVATAITIISIIFAGWYFHFVYAHHLTEPSTTVLSVSMSVYFCIFFSYFSSSLHKTTKNFTFFCRWYFVDTCLRCCCMCLFSSILLGKQANLHVLFTSHKKVRFFFFIKTKWNMNVHLFNVLIFICLLFMISHLFSSLPHSWSLMRAHWACNWKVQIHTLNVNLIRFIETLTKRREDKKKIRINNRELGAVDMMIYKLSINWIDKPDCFSLEEHGV